jgi:hypothetical protein
MDQQLLPNVFMFSQVCPSHAAGVVTVGEGPLDQLAALLQKPLALRSL